MARKLAHEANAVQNAAKSALRRAGSHLSLVRDSNSYTGIRINDRHTALILLSVSDLYLQERRPVTMRELMSHLLGDSHALSDERSMNFYVNEIASMHEKLRRLSWNRRFSKGPFPLKRIAQEHGEPGYIVTEEGWSMLNDRKEARRLKELADSYLSGLMERRKRLGFQ